MASVVKIPPYLKKGDTIGIVCPAGYMPAEKVKTCVTVLKEWGYKTRLGKTVGGEYHYFSGTDEERLADLQKMLDDDSINAVLFGRGGYGVGRIIEQIDFKKFRKKPKWIIGFSDITILHAHIFQNFNIASLHAPMANAFNHDGYKNEYVQSLRTALGGKKTKYVVSDHPFNHPGKATGTLIGGNLTLLSHLTGTASEIDTKGKILFLEDTGEYLYNLDRMFYQLKRSGKLDKLAGLILGGFTDLKDTERSFGATADEIIHHVIKEYKYPVCFDFPVSHERENYALKCGVKYKLHVGNGKVTLAEA